jgi:hypothetical protein
VRNSGERAVLDIFAQHHRVRHWKDWYVIEILDKPSTKLAPKPSKVGVKVREHFVWDRVRHIRIRGPSLMLLMQQIAHSSKRMEI